MPEVYADVAEAVFYAEDSTAPMTVFKPAAFGPGELLVFCIGQDGGSISDLTAPSGWTTDPDFISLTNLRAKVSYHIYDGTEPSTWDFTYNAGGSAAAVLLRITNADVDVPVITIPAPTATSSNAATLDSPTVTPDGGHDLLLSILTLFASAQVFSATEPTTMTDLGQIQVTGNFQATTAAKELLTAPGGTGVRTWTSISPTGRPAGAFTIAIKDRGAFDPDPPRIPPLPTVSESLLNALLAAKAQKFVGGSGNPWVQEVRSGAASGAAISVTTAADTPVGALLLAIHGNNFYTFAQLDPTGPSGTSGTWTLETSADGGSNVSHIKVWSRQTTVAGPQTVTVSDAVDEEHVLHLFVILGHDPTTPIDGAAGASGSASVSQVAPSITPTSPYPLMICAAHSQSGSPTFTPPITGGVRMDERTDLSNAPFGGGSSATQVLPGPGATGTRTFTSTVSTTWTAVSVAIRADPGTVVSGGGTRTAADDAAATDAVTRSVVLARSPSDTAAATDTATRAGLFTRTASETAAATDAAARSLALARATPETAAATDVAAGSLVSGGQSRTAADTAAATDVATRALILARVTSDTAASTDVATRGSARTRATSDAAAATDAAPRSLTVARASADTAAATDTATRTVVLARSGSDAAAATDAAARTGAWSRTAPSTAAATDTATRSLTVSRPVADTAAATDAVTRSTTRTRAASDTAIATDSATGVLGGGQSRTAADTAAATDVATRAAQTFSRTAPSTAAATDGAGRVVARFRATSDAAVATDAATKSLVRTRTATDTATASDVATRAAQAFTRAAADTALATDAAVAVQTGGVTYRPFTGSTSRPNTGTTARPGSGTTARPGSGITVRPFTGTTSRP